MESSLVDEGTLAAVAFETSFIFRFFFSFHFDFFSLALSELFGFFFEIFKSVWAPICTTERTGDLLCNRDLVFDPNFDAVNMNVAAATRLAKGKILCLLHLFMTNTTNFFWL